MKHLSSTLDTLNPDQKNEIINFIKNEQELLAGDIYRLWDIQFTENGRYSIATVSWATGTIDSIMLQDNVLTIKFQQSNGKSKILTFSKNK